MTAPHVFTFPTFERETGKLSVAEGLPFKVERVFWLHDMRGWRGGHAHRHCTQCIVPVHGRVLVVAGEWQGHLLDPSVGLVVPPGHRVDLFGPGAVVMVLCSHPYDPDDYIQKGGTE